ncbi:MAG: hypothetical protein NW701_05485 [Nitrospira sp.]
MRMLLPLMILLLFLPLVGCRGDVGPSHKIDSGVEPRYQDRDVRFRTTYYFRVFDICDVLDEDGRIGNYETVGHSFTQRRKGTYKILNDSLYRFRMTGKASAAFQNIVFESGTLRAEQIDPFGSSIDYDGERRKFQVRSASENKQIQQRSSIYAEVRSLYSLRNEADRNSHEEGKERIGGLILEQLEKLAEKSGVAGPVSMAVLAATTRESVLRAIEDVTQELALVAPDEVKQLHNATALLKKPIGEDPLFMAADDLKLNVDSLINSFNNVLSVIERAIEEQEKQNREQDAKKRLQGSESTVDPLSEAIRERMDAAVDLLKEERKKERSGKVVEPRDPEQKNRDLDKANKELVAKSDAVKRERDKLNRIPKLRESKGKIEADIYRLMRAKSILDLPPEAMRAKAQSDVSMRNPASACGDGKPSRRGFQVLGPEGFRSFDQDERLVMALSIDSKPVISMLQQFSDQRFRGGMAHTGVSAAAVALEQERLESTQQTLNELAKALATEENEDKSPNASSILTAILGAFNKSDGKPETVAEVGDLLRKGLDEVKK